MTYPGAMGTFVLLAWIAVSTFTISIVETKIDPSPKFQNYTTHPCIRPCEERRPQNCYYDFTLEYYYTLNKACYNCPLNHTDCFRPHCIPADGVSRGVMVANRMIPGPAIHVCKDDMVIVKVDNRLTGGEGTSIHWHGIHQKESQHMDGVSMLTQCPLPSSSTFEYRFKADNSGTHYWHAHSGLQRADGIFGALIVRDTPEKGAYLGLFCRFKADNSGTHYWHAHSGLQRADGIFGALIVRDTLEKEAHLGLYEDDLPEHVMIVNDWLVELSGERFAHHHHSDGDNKPLSMLINGKGVLQEFFDNTDNTTEYTPVEVYHVKLGRRYRFRTISNGIMNCPIQISVDNHTLTMIASDGSPFQKIDVQSFNIFAGERYDFVLNASMPVGNYWIRARGLADCGVKQAKQVAILRYEGAAEEDPDESITWEDADRMGKKLNPWNKEADPEHVSVSQLKSLREDQMPFKEIPDKKFYLAMDFNKIDNYHFHYVPYYQIVDVDRSQGHLYLPQMNHISFKLPPAPPLSQLDDIPEDMFCDHNSFSESTCTEHFCECVYRLKVALGDDVELVMIDEGVTFDANHPVHLHGHYFHVVGLDKLNRSTSIEDVKRLDAEGRLHRNLTHAVAKDTVTVPDGGYSILRFHANNPGFWFFHCHIEFHVDIGMAVVIQVGEKEDMPPVPKRFPKCGSWHFDGYQEDEPIDQPACNVTGVNGAPMTTVSVILTCIICSINLLLF